MTEQFLASSHRKWRTLPEAEWETIRRAYLSGVPARELCDLYEIGLSTLRLKARDGGWRHADRPIDTDLFPADADANADAKVDSWASPPEEDDATDAPIEHDGQWTDLAIMAKLRLRRAIASGRAAEAGSWMRVYDRLKTHDAAPKDPPPTPSPPSPDTEDVDDALDSLAATLREVESIARRAMRAEQDLDQDAMAAIDADVAALKARAASTAFQSSPSDHQTPALDSLDSLDPVFSDDEDRFDILAERGRLILLRDRRLAHGLAVSDIDQMLAVLDPGAFSP